MTVDERQALLAVSIADPLKPDSRRYAFRRTIGGMEWFEGRLTGYENDEPVFHGYPTRVVPARVLRLFRDQGSISRAEYHRLTKDLG